MDLREQPDVRPERTGAGKAHAAARRTAVPLADRGGGHDRPREPDIAAEHPDAERQRLGAQRPRDLVDEAFGQKTRHPVITAAQITGRYRQRQRHPFDADRRDAIGRHRRREIGRRLHDPRQPRQRALQPRRGDDPRAPRRDRPVGRRQRRHPRQQRRAQPVVIGRGRLRDGQLHRPPRARRQPDRDRHRVGLQRAARSAPDRHRVKHHLAERHVTRRRRRRAGKFGCLTRRPHLQPIAAEPRRRAQRLEPEMLARRDAVIGHQRPRPGHRRGIISALESDLRRAPVDGPVEDRCQRRRIRVRSPGEARRGDHQRPLGRRPGVADRRQPTVACDDITDPRHPPRRSLGKPGQPPARRNHPQRREQHPGQAHVGRKTHRPVTLGRQVEPRQRLAREFPRPRRSRRDLGRIVLRRIGGKCPEAEPLALVNHRPVGRVALRRAHPPLLRGRRDQQPARRRRRAPERRLERADAGRPGGDPQPRPGLPHRPRLEPGDVDHRVGVKRRRRRRLDRHRLPFRAKLVGDDLREAGPAALPGLGLWHRDGYPAIGRDLDVRPEHRLLVAPAQPAAEAPRPRRQRDDQPYSSAPPDQ